MGALAAAQALAAAFAQMLPNSLPQSRKLPVSSKRRVAWYSSRLKFASVIKAIDSAATS
jgi:hypothetical protein